MFVFLLGGISIFAYWIGWNIQNVYVQTSSPLHVAVTAPIPRAKSWMAFGVASCLAVLVFYKYTAFAITSLIDALDLVGIRWSPAIPEIPLPVGVSFFVFHAISLIVDTYRKKIKEPLSLLDSLLYVAFFPQLVAGPILRADSFLPQLRQTRDPQKIDVALAFWLIGLGLAKKVLIANFLATQLVDPVFSAPHLFSGLHTLLAIYGYAAQIYCDFSGYTDVAIGSAILLGYQFPPNFNSPYASTNIQDFWRRWHISLSSWLRDYLYISLGGSRGSGRYFTLRNLMLTMLLGGLWHGASWNFVFWGFLHGAALVVHRLWTDWRAASSPTDASPNSTPENTPSNILSNLFGKIATFHFVCAAWIFFRATSFGDAMAVFAGLLKPWHWQAIEGEPALAVWNSSWLTMCLFASLIGGILLQNLGNDVTTRIRTQLARLPWYGLAIFFAVFLWMLDILGPTGVPPFIYFQF